MVQGWNGGHESGKAKDSFIVHYGQTFYRCVMSISHLGSYSLSYEVTYANNGCLQHVSNKEVVCCEE
jgi:hypothetical protein